MIPVLAALRARTLVRLATFDFTTLTPGAVSLASYGLNFSRASTATAQTAIAAVATGIGVDTPRAGSDGTHAGLLLESTRTNLVQRSDDPWNAYYTSFNSPVNGGTTLGPDGATNGGIITDNSTSVAADRFNHSIFGTNTTVAASAWMKVVAGSTPSYTPFVNNVNVLVPGPNNAAWRRTADAAPRSSGGTAANGVDLFGAFDGTGSPTGSTAFWGIQIEAGSFPTEVINTAGSTGTRAGERLWWSAGSQLISGGRISVYVRLQPKGSSAQYGANPRVLTLDASNYIEVDASTGKVIVVQGGVAYTTPGAMTWSRLDTLELWIEAGGGLLPTKAEYRVNSGAWTILSTGSPPAQGYFTASGAMDLLCSAATQVFTAYVQRIDFYAYGQAPSGIA